MEFLLLILDFVIEYVLNEFNIDNTNSVKVTKTMNRLHLVEQKR